MQQNDIQLPADDFIDLWDFTRLIAKAIWPSLREIKDHSWLQKKIAHLPGSDFGTQFEITAEERDSLVRLLPELPARAGMSKAEREAFMEIYLEHPDRFPWVPRFVTDEEVTANGFKILEIQERHLLALQRKIASGEIVALDAHHVTETRVGKNIFIRREDALRYLQQQHLQANKDQPPPTASPSPKRSIRSKNDTSPANVPRDAKPDKITVGNTTRPPAGELKAVPSTEQVTKAFAPSTATSRPNSAPPPKKISPDEGKEVQDIRSLKAPLVILRRKQVEARTALSRSAIYDKLDPNSPRHDPSFPKQIKLSASSSGWVESEIDNWLTGRMNARRN